MARIAALANRRTSQLAIRLSMCVAAMSTVGCTFATYNAESMPDMLRVTSRSNPQEVDLARLAAQSVSSELIAPGDVLEVTIAAGLSIEDTYTIPVRISEQDGSGSLPVLGRIRLSGLSFNEAEAVIFEHCVNRKLYNQPHVTVTMKQQRMNRVQVVGAVEHPNTYEIPRQHCDLVAAITAAGGLSENAGRHVEIRFPTKAGGSPIDRTSPRIAGHAAGGVQQVGAEVVVQPANMGSVKVDLISASKSGTNGYVVPDGAVVYVKREDPAPVTVIGLVRKTGPINYPVGKDLRVLDAIGQAGGRSISMADKVFVIRPKANSHKSDVIKVSIAKAKSSQRSNVLLKPGDTVSVEHTPATVITEWIQILRVGIGTTFSPL